MFIQHQNIICVTATAVMQVIGNNINTYSSYCKRGHIKVVRKGGGANNPALIDFNSIRKPEIKEALVRALGQPEVQAAKKEFKDLVGIDSKAVEYLSQRCTDIGTDAALTSLRSYITNANILNALHLQFTKLVEARRKNGKKWNGYWPAVAKAIANLKADAELSAHTLPKNSTALQRVYKAYIDGIDTDGPNYESLISGKLGNQNSLKVSEATEQVLMALYVEKGRPFAIEVYNEYMQFVKGHRTLVDARTGEVFNPADHKPISEATVRNWLKNGFNEVLADSFRMGYKNFNDSQRPYQRRKAPVYAFSKFSMDDRDLPRKLASGHRVKAYYTYDVASGACVGYAHSQSKDEALFLDCLRNTFQTIYGNNWNTPAEVEVENHLVSQFFTELEAMFPYLTICAPGNSQEKRAEHFNRAKKYGAEKKLQGAIGRWWAKGKAYKVDQDWVNGEFVGKAHTFVQLVADDIYAIQVYNNELHPNQKLYPGLTRWQVLQECQNPNLKPVNRALVAKCVGLKAETTIVRNQSVRVQYADYRLPNLQALDRLQPGNKKVQAYFLPAPDGVINEVYVYQDNTYIGAFGLIERYQEAKIERTAADERIRLAQHAYIKAFDAEVKRQREAMPQIGVVHSVEQELVPLVTESHTQLPSTTQWPAATEFEQEAYVPLSFDADQLRKDAKNGL